jgi:hypothetical protein
MFSKQNHHEVFEDQHKQVSMAERKQQKHNMRFLKVCYLEGERGEGGGRRRKEEEGGGRRKEEGEDE